MDTPSSRHGILVIASETCPCPDLRDEIVRRADRVGAEVLIVAPAINASRLAHLVSDSDGSMAPRGSASPTSPRASTPASRSASTASSTRTCAFAADDAVHAFATDELIIATHPPDRSHWLERNLVQAARDDHDLLVTHVVTSYGLEEEPAEGLLLGGARPSSLPRARPARSSSRAVRRPG